MILNFNELSASQCYFAMVQSIIPRPIAWVLSDNGSTGESPQSQKTDYNLAPFSFFTGICSDPPLLMLSVGKKTTGDEVGAEKDTRKNIAERKVFVVHIANTTQLNALNQTAATLNHGDSELHRTGLSTVPFEGFPLPRVSGCGIALGCRLYQMDEIGNTPQAVIYGQIEKMYVDDALICPHDTRLMIDPKRVDPLSRLGGSHYAALGELLGADRPQ